MFFRSEPASAAIVILNGAFGIGKSTVAQLLARRLPEAAIFDPEKIGYVLMRLPALLPGSAKRFDDYQDSPLWRRLVVTFGRMKTRAAPLVVMPMTFVRIDYLAEIKSGFRRAGIRTHEVCLTANDETVLGRLTSRGLDPESAEGRWVYPRSTMGAALHRAGGFGVAIATDGRDAQQVTDLVLERLQSEVPRFSNRSAHRSDA